MIYECERCLAALPPRVTACPACGDPFEEPVPADAVVPQGEQPSSLVFQAYPLPNTTVSASPTLVPVVKRGTVLAWLAGGAVLVIASAFVFPLAHWPRAGQSPLASRPSLPSPILRAHWVPPPSRPLLTKHDAPPTRVETHQTASRLTPSHTPRELSLKVISERFTHEYGYDIVVGEIKNVSRQRLEGLTLVTTFMDGDEHIVKTTKVPLPDPIGLRQTRPYRIVTAANPRVVRESTAFHAMDGTALITDRTRRTTVPKEAQADAAGETILKYANSLAAPANAGLLTYVGGLRESNTPGFIGIRMKASFSALTPEKQQKLIAHLWNLWHWVSRTSGDGVNIEDADGGLIGRVTKKGTSASAGEG